MVFLVKFLVQGKDSLLRWAVKCDTLSGHQFGHFVDPLVKVLQNALIALSYFVLRNQIISPKSVITGRQFKAFIPNN
tara:strand:+ start:1058 stop:1288 length:231 start_codon:yes stop_codon:yes gene_type:complete